MDRYGPTLLFQTFREGLLGDHDFQPSTSRGLEEAALAETLNDVAEMVSESITSKSCLRPLVSHRGSMGSSDQRRRREYYSSLQAKLDEVYVRRNSGSMEDQLSENLVRQWGGGWGKPGYAPTALARENGLLFDCGERGMNVVNCGRRRSTLSFCGHIRSLKSRHGCCCLFENP